jgi:hypothetical protein
MTNARGIRNNNPGNIRHGSQWMGLATQQTDKDFAQFIHMRYGIRALIKLLRTYRSKHKLTTVRGIIGRWAPPNENDTNAYVQAVARALSVSPDADIPETPFAYEILARAIAAHENGDKQAALIAPEDWIDGVRLGFDLPPAAATTIPPVTDPIPPRVGPPAPIVDVPPRKEAKMPAPIIPVLTALLPTIVNAIPALGRLFGSGSEVSERNVQAAEIVGKIIVEATGSRNLQEATERIVTDPVARQQAAEAVNVHWFELAEAGGGGITGAREWNDASAAGDAPLWRMPAVVVTMMLMPLIYFVVYQVMTDITYTSEIRTMVVSLVVGTTLGAIVGFFLGSSFGSQKKDATAASAARAVVAATLPRL